MTLVSFDFQLFHLQKQVLCIRLEELNKAEMCGKSDLKLKKWQSLVDDLFQNLFLEMKTLEIEETYFVSVLKVVY